ncbi:hypothetical protein [Clostridium culturomicium]|uniref:hypothetical protein n=1 Tax=Clostridium culturomicium TaxID=1499683 RepID=UPI00058B9E4E|nr:hypothetical protein [Clostridium culturomicium]
MLKDDYGWEEIRGLEQVIFFIYSELEVEPVAEEGRTIFYVNTKDSKYDDVMMTWLNAFHDMRGVTIDYNRYLKSQKYVRNIMAMNRK